MIYAVHITGRLKGGRGGDRAVESGGIGGNSAVERGVEGEIGPWRGGGGFERNGSKGVEKITGL